MFSFVQTCMTIQSSDSDVRYGDNGPVSAEIKLKAKLIMTRGVEHTIRIALTGFQHYWQPLLDVEQIVLRYFRYVQRSMLWSCEIREASLMTQDRNCHECDKVLGALQWHWALLSKQRVGVSIGMRAAEFVQRSLLAKIYILLQLVKRAEHKRRACALVECLALVFCWGVYQIEYFMAKRAGKVFPSL